MNCLLLAVVFPDAGFAHGKRYRSLIFAFSLITSLIIFFVLGYVFFGNFEVSKFKYLREIEVWKFERDYDKGTFLFDVNMILNKNVFFEGQDNGYNRCICIVFASGLKFIRYNTRVLPYFMKIRFIHVLWLLNEKFCSVIRNTAIAGGVWMVQIL